MLSINPKKEVCKLGSKFSSVAAIIIYQSVRITLVQLLVRPILFSGWGTLSVTMTGLYELNNVITVAKMCQLFFKKHS